MGTTRNKLDGEARSHVSIFYVVLKNQDFFLKIYEEPIKDFKKENASCKFRFRRFLALVRSAA